MVYVTVALSMSSSRARSVLYLSLYFLLLLMGETHRRHWVKVMWTHLKTHRLGRKGDAFNYKGPAQGRFCGDGAGAVLYLDWAGGYSNLCVIRWHKTTHTHCSNTNVLILILCYSHIRCHHWGTWMKGTGNLSLLFLQLCVNLLLFDSKNWFKS